MTNQQSPNHFDSVQASLIDPITREPQLAWLSPCEVEGEPAIAINLTGRDVVIALQGAITVRDGGLVLSPDPLYEPEYFTVEAVTTNQGIKLETTKLDPALS